MTVDDESLFPTQSASEVFGQPRDPLKHSLQRPPSTSHGAPVGSSKLVPAAQSATAQGPPVGASVPTAQPATAQGPPVGLSAPATAQQEPTVAQDGCPDGRRPRLRSATFSDTNIVRTYSSQEIIERDPSISDFTRLEVFSFDEEASLLKEHDGPGLASGLVDNLVQTLFNDQPRDSAALCTLLGPARCGEVARQSAEIAKRFDELLARLQALEPGQAHGLLPSNSKLTKQHAVWIQQLASWVANDIAAAPKPEPPVRKYTQKRSMCGICGARTVEARE